MPNTVVKLINAESTRPEAAREDRKLLIKRERDIQRWMSFFICQRGEGSGGWKRREKQAADKERKDIQRWMSFFIYQREGKIPAAGNGGGDKPMIKRERTFRDGWSFSFVNLREYS